MNIKFKLILIAIIISCVSGTNDKVYAQSKNVVLKPFPFNPKQDSLWKCFRRDLWDSELSKEEQKVEIKKVYKLISLCRNNRALFDSLINLDENIKYKAMPVLTSHLTKTPIEYAITLPQS